MKSHETDMVSLGIFMYLYMFNSRDNSGLDVLSYTQPLVMLGEGCNMF